MIIYLLTPKIARLRQLRQSLEELGHTVVACCSASSLLNACVRGPGEIIVDGSEYAPSDVREIQEKIRVAGYPNAILVTEPYPSAEKALEWMQIEARSYFTSQILSESLREIVEKAERWMKTEGENAVIRVHLTRQWRNLDAGLKDVLHLLYAGNTNREIAEKLAISSRTVENRRAKLLVAFGVKSFAELIRIATLFMEEGVLPASMIQPTLEESKE